MGVREDLKEGYSEVVFFKNKKESDNMYSYLQDYLKRQIIFGEVRGFLLGMNIWVENNSFSMSYNLRDFKKVRILDEKMFYIPKWVKEVYIYVPNLIDGYGCRNEAIILIFPGYYYLKKINSRDRVMIYDTAVIDNYDDLTLFEDFSSVLYDIKKIKIKSKLFSSTIYTDCHMSSIFRILQRPLSHTFSMTIESNPEMISAFFYHDTAYLITSKYEEKEYYKNLEPVELLISSKFKYCKRGRVSRGLENASWEEMKEYILETLTKYIIHINDIDKEIFLYYNGGNAKFKLKFLDYL